MKHLEKKELDVLRFLQHRLKTILKIGEENVKFLDFHYTPGRRRNMSRLDGEHYIAAGKNIEGVFFDIFGDEWLFYVKTGSGYPYLMLKIKPDYLKPMNERRSRVINGEILYDRLLKRIVNDIREFYKFSPEFFDFDEDETKDKTVAAPKLLSNWAELTKPK
jgi:hypothetical protein